MSIFSLIENGGQGCRLDCSEDEGPINLGFEGTVVRICNTGLGDAYVEFKKSENVEAGFSSLCIPRQQTVLIKRDPFQHQYMAYCGGGILQVTVGEMTE